MCFCLLLRPFLLSFVFILLSCTKAGFTAPPFETVPKLYDVIPGIIDEASGIGDSYANPGFLWVELDSGNPPALYLLKHDGTLGKTIHLKGANNRDWEDLVVSNGPVSAKKYLYVGEIGDNDQVYGQYSIYRMPEPMATADSISDFDKINFVYPDGSHDAEAMLIDPVSNDIYVITKRDQASKVYKIAFPQSTTTMNKASFVMDLPYKGVVSATLSPKQTEILVKTYSSIYYYKKKETESFEHALHQQYQSLAYQVEAQGESICFSNDNTGFFTLSEKAFLPSAKLNFYKRK